MPTDEEAQPSYTAAEYYGFFMTGLLGLEDDAQLSGYDAAGIEHLRKAVKIFGAEFRRRHPDAWIRKDQNSN
jgi:hypothetical protein